ncbi:haloacid dehalogenase type II [Neptunomonas phycophila]|uniref:haloacid dehalogenase type II n=1 Tax=Neptunomonas phycophila TaxID=1572645 RepID=UPI001BE6E416|nr:haloacid dehalogenase type II [Neptunomonas phycophila]MBT3144474.1 haloacid dehalogenase type II [Neptunomonas phycophila]MDO6784177.1 haloacid dehalogenase type II [Neptunomonas phycophila]
MKTTLAFDVYGTLIDTQGVLTQLQAWVGDDANALSLSWRNKQLEYSFRRGLMQDYQPFSVCTRDALNYACSLHKVVLTHEQKEALLQSYLTLPAFDDVAVALDQLSRSGLRLFAFSNGERSAVESLLSHAHIEQYFEGVVSCDDIKTFKPNPAVYKHLTNETHSLTNETWLVSSNPFDVLGAMSSGLKSAWVCRSEASIFDPWGQAPTETIADLLGLTTLFDRQQ